MEMPIYIYIIGKILIFITFLHWICFIIVEYSEKWYSLYLYFKEMSVYYQIKINKSTINTDEIEFEYQKSKFVLKKNNNCFFPVGVTKSIEFILYRYELDAFRNKINKTLKKEFWK